MESFDDSICQRMSEGINGFAQQRRNSKVWSTLWRVIGYGMVQQFYPTEYAPQAFQTMS